jgi:hypothetical protein
VVTADIPMQQVTLNNQVAVKSFPIRFTRNTSSTGTYELAVRVVPDTGSSDQTPPVGMGAFEGVYVIGDWNKIMGGGSLNLASDAKDHPDFQLKNYLAKTLMMKEQLGVSIASFELGTGSILPDGLKDGQGESQDYRDIAISFSFPVLSALDRQLLPGHRFRVYSLQQAPGEAPRSKEIDTDGLGNLVWKDFILHNYYKIQKRYPFDLVIEDADPRVEPSKRARIVKKILVNPWNLYVTFGRTEDQEVTFDEPKNMPKLISPVEKVPTLKIDYVCFNRTDSSYNVDLDLALNVKHRYNAEISGMVYRYDDITTGIATPPENLRAGYYLLTVLLMRNDIPGGKVSEVVTSYQTVFKNMGQFPTAEIEFALKNNLDVMPVRDFVVVQINQVVRDSIRLEANGDPVKGTPFKIQTDTDLVSPSYILPFNPTTEPCQMANIPGNWTDPRLVALQNDLAKVPAYQRHLDRLQQLAQQPQLSEAEREESQWRKTAETYGLTPMLVENDRDAKQVLQNRLKINASQLQQALDCLDQESWAPEYYGATCMHDPTVKSIALLICPLFFANRDQLLECEKDPTQALRVEEETAVYNLNEAKTHLVSGFMTNLTIANTYGLGAFYGSDYGGAVSDGARLSAGFTGDLSASTPPAGAVKASASATAGVSGDRSWTSFVINFQREFKENILTISNNVTLSLENADFALEVTRYRKCYVITNVVQPELKGAMVCFPVVADADHPLAFTERYFFAFNAPPNGAILDSADMRNRWMLGMRGERDYYVFISQISRVGQFHYNNMPVEVSDILKSGYQRIVQRVPVLRGMLSSTTPQRETFERLPGTIKDLGPIWKWNPWHDFENHPNRDLNDPRLQKENNRDPRGLEKKAN